MTDDVTLRTSHSAFGDNIDPLTHKRLSGVPLSNCPVWNIPSEGTVDWDRQGPRNRPPWFVHISFKSSRAIVDYICPAVIYLFDVNTHPCQISLLSAIFCHPQALSRFVCIYPRASGWPEKSLDTSKLGWHRSHQISSFERRGEQGITSVAYLY